MARDIGSILIGAFMIFMSYIGVLWYFVEPREENWQMFGTVGGFLLIMGIILISYGVQD